MLLRHVALVSESESVNFKSLMRVSAALQKQAIKDLGPIWNIKATVDAFESLDDVPIGYWPNLFATTFTSAPPASTKTRMASRLPSCRLVQAGR